MFSIIIPLFNKASQIEQCLKSIEAQSFRDFEVIIIDDGSTDNSVEIIQNLDLNFDFFLLNKENGGVSSARNLGIVHAKFPYVAFLDADDSWNSRYLENANYFIRKKALVDIIGTSYTSQIEDLETLSNYQKVENYFQKAIKNTLFLTSGVIVRRSILNEFKFNEKLKYGEDLELWFTIISKYNLVYYSQTKSVFYSKDDTQSLTKSIKDVRFSFYFEILSNKYNTIPIGFREKFFILNSIIYYRNPINQDFLDNKIKDLPSKYLPLKLILRLRNIFGFKFSRKLLKFFLFKFY